jgi:L-asparaginase/Glu-tRNA(Gln) amidotransferase subunit D
LNSTIVLKIAKFANEVLCGEGSTTDGLVITHGTDTIEETAMLGKLAVREQDLVVHVERQLRHPLLSTRSRQHCQLWQARRLCRSYEALDRHLR